MLQPWLSAHGFPLSSFDSLPDDCAAFTSGSRRSDSFPFVTSFGNFHRGVLDQLERQRERVNQQTVGFVRCCPDA